MPRLLACVVAIISIEGERLREVTGDPRVMTCKPEEASHMSHGAKLSQNVLMTKVAAEFCARPSESWVTPNGSQSRVNE